MLLKLLNKLAFRLKPNASRSVIKQLVAFARTLLLSGVQGVRERFLENLKAESTVKLAGATIQVLKALEKYPEVVLRFPHLLIIKWSDSKGRPKISVLSVSTEVRHFLDTNPQLLLDPSKLIGGLKNFSVKTSDFPDPATLSVEISQLVNVPETVKILPKPSAGIEEGPGN